MSDAAAAAYFKGFLDRHPRYRSYRLVKPTFISSVGSGVSVFRRKPAEVACYNQRHPLEPEPPTPAAEESVMCPELKRLLDDISVNAVSWRLHSSDDVERAFAGQGSNAEDMLGGIQVTELPSDTCFYLGETWFRTTTEELGDDYGNKADTLCGFRLLLDALSKTAVRMMLWHWRGPKSFDECMDRVMASMRFLEENIPSGEPARLRANSGEIIWSCPLIESTAKDRFYKHPRNAHDPQDTLAYGFYTLMMDVDTEFPYIGQAIEFAVYQYLCELQTTTFPINKRAGQPHWPVIKAVEGMARRLRADYNIQSMQ